MGTVGSLKVYGASVTQLPNWSQIITFVYVTEASFRVCPPGHEKLPGPGAATVMVPVVCPLRIGKFPPPVTGAVIVSLFAALG